MDCLSGLGNAAVAYAEMGLGIIPLAESGKVPVVDGGCKNWCDDPETVRKAWTDAPTANIGLCTGILQGGEGLLVIDLDCKDNANGLETIAAWQESTGMELPQTVEQLTPTGGRHLVYRTNRELSGFANTSRGVDLRAQRGYIVVEPSIHPNGGTYEWLTSFEDMEPAEANEAVYEFIEAMHPGEKVTNCHSQTWDKFNLPDLVTKGERDVTMYKLACSLRSASVPEAEATDRCLSINQERFVPPLAERTVRQKVRSAYKNPEGHSAGFRVHKGGKSSPKVSPEFDGNAALKKEPDKDGQPQPNKVWWIHQKIESDGLLAPVKLNTLDGMVHVTAPCVPGYDWECDHVLDWDTEGSALFQLYEHSANVTKRANFEAALKSYAGQKGQCYNPIRDMRSIIPEFRPVDDYFCEVSFDHGSTWEREPKRRGNLLSTYLDCESNGLSAVGTYTFDAETVFSRQLAARMMWPGCKADAALVIAGKQGTGKSTFARLLSLKDEFFQEGIKKFDIEDKKRIAGKLVVEIPEMESFNNTDRNKIKTFITETKDNYRNSYGKSPIDHLRTACFVCTTNDVQVLNDPTGARRFMVVESLRAENDAHPSLFDGTAERDVAIWWAESIWELEQQIAEKGEVEGKRAFLSMCRMPSRSIETARDVAEKHTIEDKTRNIVETFLDSFTGDTVNVKLVMREAMGYDTKDYANAKGYVAAEITRVMDSIAGWRRCFAKQTRVPGFGRSKVAWERTEAF